MEPEPGSPAYYERLAAAGPPVALHYDIPGGPPPILKLPLPPEAVESNANRKYRENKTRFFRKLNNPFNDRYRKLFKEKMGVNWVTVRNQKKKQFQNELNGKEASRQEAMKRHRNKEWAAYLVEHRKWRNSLPKGPGIPTLGDPVRLFGGKTRRNRNSKKKRRNEYL